MNSFWSRAKITTEYMTKVVHKQHKLGNHSFGLLTLSKIDVASEILCYSFLIKQIRQQNLLPKLCVGHPSAAIVYNSFIILSILLQRLIKVEIA